MARSKELSQLARLVSVDDQSQSIVLPTSTQLEGGAKLPPVDLEILPEVLSIQVSATTPGDDIVWNWTWLQSTLPYARATITNSPQLSVPLYKKGTYTLDNFIAYETFGDLTQTHPAYLKWIDGAGTDNVVSWATYVQTTSSHPDINDGLPTQVQRYTILVPENLTLPTLTLPQGIGYGVSFDTAGSYTFGADMIEHSPMQGAVMHSVASGQNPNIGPMYRGATYTFYLDPTVENHPFYLTTDNGQGFIPGQYVGEYTSGVTGSRNNGTTGKETITFTVPMDAPDILYYQCGNHQSMRGIITIRDLAVEVNSKGNYVLYFQHTHEGHKTPIEIRPIPSLVNQMCLVYSAAAGKFVPQDLSTYIENTPSFKAKIQEVAGTATLVDASGEPIVATVKIFSDPSYLPFAGNKAGDIAYTEDTNTMFIWDETAYNWVSTKAKNTSEIAEGTNLYYTDARVRSVLTADNIANKAYVDSAVAGKDNTDEITEGSTNLYYTSARANADFDTRLATKSTTNLAEGTNQYFTTARARSSISATGSLSYNSTTGVISYTTPTTIASLSNHTTSNLAEGTNLYYTDARVGTYLANNAYATQTYVNTAVSNLVAAAPTTLDTLNELAAALGDDPNFATTVSNQIGLKLDASAYTASDVLTKIKTVDGSGSGLDADTLDGYHFSDLESRYINVTGDNITGTLTWIAGSGLDTATNDVYANMRVIRNGNASAAHLYLGYSNAGSGNTRIYGGGSSNAEFIVYSNYAEATTSLRAPIFYDSNNTAYYLDLANTSTSGLFAGNVGVGTTTPSAKLHVYGTAFPLARIERETTVTNGMRSTFSAIHRTTGDMVDGFGADISFGIRDSAGVDNEIANFGAIRDGADNSGALVFSTVNAGVGQGSIKAILKANGYFGIGTSNPANNLHVESAGNTYVKVRNSSVAKSIFLGAESDSRVGIYAQGDSGQATEFFINNGSETKVDTSGNLFASASVRAPIFYDSNDTGYYIDAASTSNINSINIKGASFSGGSTGFSIGGNPIAQQLASAAANHGNQGSVYDVAFMKSWNVYGYNGSSWVNLGNTVSLGITTGHWSGNWGPFGLSRSYSQFIIDCGNTGYVFWNAMMAHHSTNGNSFDWYFERSSSSTYNSGTWTAMASATGQGSWPGGSTLQINGMSGGGSSEPYTRIRIVPTWSHASNGISFGPLTLTASYGASREYLFNWDNSKNFLVDTSVRAPIFYDSNDTAYYVDPAGVSKINGLDIVTSTSDAYVKLESSSSWNGIYYANSGSLKWAAYVTSSDLGNYKIRYINDGYDTLTVSAGGTVTASGSSRAPIFYDSNDTGYYADFSSTGTSINTAGDIVSNSDARLKENVEPITDALNKVLALNGVTFNKIGETDRKTGVIAQDVEAVLPEAVTQQGEFKSVAYGNMVGLLIEAIKEQQTQIEMLKQEIITLKGGN